MKKNHELICINCPMGCHLEVIELENGEWLVKGNQCPRGKSYAIKELTAPTRVLSTTVIINHGFLNRLPVRTNIGLPKEKLFDAMNVINHVVVDAPIKRGDVIIKNILGTGVDVISSRSMD
jgi:CxxC motif-containing protein